MTRLEALRQTGRSASEVLGVRVGVARLRRWPRLTPPARRRLIAGLASGPGARLARALGMLTSSRRAADRRRVAMIARTTPAPEAIGFLPRLFRDADESVSREARRSFELLAGASHCLRGAQRGALLRALFATLSGAEDPELRRMVAEWIAAAGPDAPSALADLLSTADEGDLMTLRGAIRRTDAPDGAVLALRWLGHEPARPAALARVAGVFAPELLDASHLLRHPARARAARQAIERSSPLPTPGAISELSAGKRLDALRWRQVARPARSARTEELRVALTDPSARARALAVANCVRANHRPEELADFVFDSSGPVARIAAFSLDREALGDRRVIERLARSEHAVCRAVASSHRRACDREATLDWRRRLCETPDLAYAELRGALCAGDPHRRISALRLIDRVDLVDRFADAILDAALDADPRVAATGVLLASRIRSPRAKVVLGAGIGHADARVRANAVEGAARLDPAGAVVQGALHDDHARLRANAIHAFLIAEHSPAAASDALDAMLSDDRPGHRLSALWVAERTAALGFSEAIARIATREPDPVVRRRAQRCARRLLAEHRFARVAASAQVESA